MKLAVNADVLVENMRVKVKHRLGIAYDDLKGINPRLIYASISGFGQTGPYGERAGVDQIAQGMGGMMTITGEPGRGPMRAGIPFVDLTAGNLLALAVMMALFQREKTGQGRYVHTSLLEGVNNRIKVIKRMAYGFRDSDYFFLKIKAAFPGKTR
jgi:formyl-CoA transferase